MKKLCLGLCALLVCASSIFGQSFEGTEFWVSWLPNYDGASAGGVSHEMHIISKVDTKAFIEIPKGGVPFYDTIDVPAFTVTTYVFQNLQRTFTTNSEVVMGKGVRVSSNDPVLIYLGNYQQFSTDVAIALPFDACGDEYDIVTISDANGASNGLNLTQFVVVGNEDNTNLQITIKGQTQSGDITGNMQMVTLDKGDTYTVIADEYFGDPSSDLTGTKIISTNNKKFSVYTGNNCAMVGDCGNCDHLFEQVRPTNTLGKVFHVATTDKSYNLEDVIRVYASKDNTSYSYDGVAQPILNQGEYKDFDLQGGLEIIADKPIQVTQILKGHRCAPIMMETDPLMIDILPSGLQAPNYTFGTSSYSRFSVHYMTVISEAAEIPNLLLDGAPLTITNWTPIAGTTKRYGSQVLQRGTSYTLSNTQNQPFSLFIYGYGERETYGYAAGGQLINLDICPEVDFSYEDGQVGVPVDFTDLTDPGEFSVVEWVWDFGDNNAQTITTGPGNTTHTYNQPGYYTVTLTVTNNAAPEPCTETISKIIKIGEVDPCLWAGYRFDENTLDFSVNQVHGVNNGAQYSDGVDGTLFSSLYFNGLDYVDLGDLGDFARHWRNFEVSFYYKADILNLPETFNQVIFHGVNEEFQTELEISVFRNDQNEGLLLKLLGSNNARIVREWHWKPLFDGKFHCVNLSVDTDIENPQGNALYFDGRFFNEFSIQNDYPIILPLTGNCSYFLGQRVNPGSLDRLNGYIDDFQLFSCPTEISACNLGIPNEFFIDLNFQWIDCDGLSIIGGDITGGVEPITYVLDGTETNTSLFFDTVPSGVHTIVATDANGSVREAQIQVGPPDIIVENVRTFDAGCNGVKGAIEVELCGYEPFAYFLDGQPVSGPFIGDLAPGTYTLTIEDLFGNLFEQIVTINYEPRVVGVVVKHLNCEGSLDGRIQVNMSCNDPDVRYQLNNGALQDFNVFSNLLAGTYEVKVHNGYGDVFHTETVEVIEGDPILVEDFEVLNPTCAGINNGAIEILSPKRPGLLYSIYGGAPFTTQTYFDNLPAGDYELVILDQVGCVSAKIPATLENLQTVVINNTEVIKQPSCFPNKDGRIQVDVSGGFGNYGYGFNNIGFFESDTLENLPGDATISIFARDHLGCLSDTVDVDLPYLGKLEIAVEDLVDASCFTDENGEVRVTSNGGTQGMGVRYFDGMGFGNRFYRNDLAQGSYATQLRDMNGCVSDTAYFDIENTGILRAPDIIVKPINCDYPTDTLGGVAVFPNPLAGNYEYSFNAGTDWKLPNDSIDLVKDQVLQVQVHRDGCYSEVFQVTVGEAIPLDTVLTSVVPETCYEFFDGSITLDVVGGGGNYTYSLNGGPEQTSNVFTGLSSSNGAIKRIRVYTDDVCGLTNNRVFKEFDINIGLNLPLTLLQYHRDPITCNGYSDGQIEMIISGGDPIFEFTVDGGATWVTNGTFTGLSAGPYNLQVRDGRGCYTPIYATNLPNPAPITIQELITKNIDCYGTAKGEIEVNGFGGSQEYQYSIDNGSTYQDGSSFFGLTAGVYQVAFNDLQGCGTEFAQVTITQNDSLELKGVTQSTQSCIPGSDGSVELFPRGGKAPYALFNEQGDQLVGTQVSNLDAGTYSYYIQDALGCKSVWQGFEVLPLTFPRIDSAKTQDVSCNGLADGAIWVYGPSTFHYSMDGGATFKPNGFFFDLEPGTYEVLVADQMSGCQFTVEDLIITEPEPLVFETVETKSIFCYGDLGAFKIQVIEGVGPFSYSIDGGFTFVDNPEFTRGAGNVVTRVKDGLGCLSQPQTFSLNQPPLLTVDVTVTPTVMGDDGRVSVEASGGTPPYAYALEASFFQSDSLFTGVSEGSYQLQVRDANGCLKVIEVEVDDINSVSEGYFENSNLVVFPNPGTGLFYIRGGEEIQTISVYTILGQELEVFDNQYEIDLRARPSGTYLFQMTYKNGSQELRRVVKE